VFGLGDGLGGVDVLAELVSADLVEAFGSTSFVSPKHPEEGISLLATGGQRTVFWEGVEREDLRVVSRLSKYNAVLFPQIKVPVVASTDQRILDEGHAQEGHVHVQLTLIFLLLLKFFGVDAANRCHTGSVELASLHNDVSTRGVALWYGYLSDLVLEVLASLTPEAHVLDTTGDEIPGWTED